MNQKVKIQKHPVNKEYFQEPLTYQNTLILENDAEASVLYGSHDRHLRLIRDAFHVQLVARHGLLKLEGEKEQVDASKEVLNRLLEIVRSTGRLDLEDVEQAIVDAKNVSGEDSSQTIDVFQRGIFIKPKTDGQAKYIEAIKKNDLVFCIGPAGTGKTYLAVALALSFLKSGRIRRIVLARPAVEAGEKLGYLPGDIKAKVNPYLRPLYDAIADMMDVGHVKKYLETDLIEILPLAYMRGRTLNDSFIILDEAQNCTVKQMKTFLTRLGVKSKVVVTGDITQVDLPAGEMSGLIDVQERLMNINNVSFVYLTKADIVRHKLVQDIVDAYES
ncbi:MAG: PhoH family protein [Candidatus Brocadia sinica]|uniref:PhoH-like protein n=1 Tax=Candidatus Brocadia sinica JPN1 TaxID=1197129 RepID=A0ABQ0JYX1_9BACT|nr:MULTISPECIES: PhoH family protein [Brocadia]MCK6469340.1 PhoH family protein [Candidatus Brocadia sinica]GAN33886.1 phosphate starvation-inducible protein PhoH and related proteins [Candidatus Brocadia sinica JPN1]GIK14799.1 MAG: phosphate starvation protein PhoH [Candidatus Brocadia sinica]GJQ18170.1 MAG: phosphate starvation protein PhoH [Candidatus Brocadia sinica]